MMYDLAALPSSGGRCLPSGKMVRYGGSQAPVSEGVVAMSMTSPYVPKTDVVYPDSDGSKQQATAKGTGRTPASGGRVSLASAMILKQHKMKTTLQRHVGIAI
jgi:hypothetical protein